MTGLPAPRRIDACRLCKSKDLTTLFSLGEQLVSDFVDAEHVKDGVKCPIELVLCRACGLVQQRWTAPQDLLYSRKYWYRSGVTATMRVALQDVADACRRRCSLEDGDVVLDIGSNDGTLLKCFPASMRRIGCEPATNFHKEYEGTGIDLIPDFWSWNAYAMTGGSVVHVPKAKLVTALGMFYDLEDPGAFIRDVARVLHPDGVFCAQLMCLQNMLDLGDVGNLCHEHLEFYSLESLERLFGDAGLEMYDLEVNSINGCSYRLWVRHKGRALSDFAGGESPNLRMAFEHERQQKLDDPNTYATWFTKAGDNLRAVAGYVERATAIGKRVWVYGASTKGNVLLQWCNLGHGDITAAADRSPEKHGKFTVGTGIPIVGEEEFKRVSPDYALILPYAFTSEFVEREREWLLRGGKFLVPLPEFKVVGKEALK